MQTYFMDVPLRVVHKRRPQHGGGSCLLQTKMKGVLNFLKIFWELRVCCIRTDKKGEGG